MQAPQPETLSNLLGRVRRGQADIEELASAVSELEFMCSVTPPGDAARYMADLDAAVKEKGIGNVRVGDAAPARMAGTNDDAGAFLPYYFTDDDIAREWAVLTGLIEPQESVMLTTMSPDRFVWDVLVKQWGGFVLNPGTDHELHFDRPLAARLYALLTLPSLASEHQLIALFSGDGMYLERVGSSGQVQAYVFTNREAADYATPHLKMPDANARPIDTALLLRMLLNNGVTRLMVDPALPMQRTYARDEIERILSLHSERVPQASHNGAAAAPVETPHQDTATMATDESGADLDDDPHASTAAMADTTPDPVSPTRAARRYPSIPPVPPCGHSTEQARRMWTARLERGRDEQIPSWEEIDFFAFELDWYVPLHERPVDGLRWPGIWQHPEQEGRAVTHVYTDMDGARAAQDADTEFVHLSGIEAMRWLRAAPKPIDEVIFNAYDGGPGWLRMPLSMATAAIYPQLIDIPSLNDPRSVPFSQLSRLPGARGLKPEVVRRLIQSWKVLLGANGADGRHAVTARSGHRWLTAFSSNEAYAEFDEVDAGQVESPRHHKGTALFETWLRELGETDGVILDPAGPHPLTLDPTDLLFLSLWAREERQPNGTDVVKEVARLHADGAISDRTAGSIVADWPVYWMALDESGPQRQVLMPMDVDACALFSSHERAQFFLTAAREAGLIGEGMEPLQMNAAWQGAIFGMIPGMFERGGWIDPMPLNAGLGVWAASFLGETDAAIDPTMVMDGYEGLRVEGPMLAAVLEQLDRRLKPRLDGWVVD
jgi:hypothetical protein